MSVRAPDICDADELVRLGLPPADFF